MDKFGRNYSLSIQTSAAGDFLTITLPFTVQFDITRNTLTSANVCQVRIYNLSEKNRNLLRFNVSDYGTFRGIELKAGYGNNLAEIFSGNISQAWSVREGTNFITQIECYDGGFAFNNGFTNTTFPAGTPRQTQISTLITSLPHVSVGVVSPNLEQTTRGNAVSGNTVSLLSGDLTGGSFFIDRGKGNVLLTNEYIAAVGGVTLISAKTGLLGTPVLERNILRFEMLFEPGLNVGESVLVTSLTNKAANGLYKITAVKHRGMISESVCGAVTTTGEFFYDKLLVPVT